MKDMDLIVDAHLDLAWNALNNDRDLTRPLSEIRAAEPADHPAVAMTSLDGFARGGVGLVFATLYATPPARWAQTLTGYPFARKTPVYETPAEAKAIALEMLELYERWAADGRVRLITSTSTLDDHLRRFDDDRVPGLLVLMEGADPIVEPDDLAFWFDRGVRMVGLSWGSTRYAGGTGSSAGLTELGRELLDTMAQLGVIHDAAHLSEEAFWQACALPHRGLCVTHATARALMTTPGIPGRIPLNRFLSDAQIAEVARPRGAASSGGVVGIALLNIFLEPRWDIDAAGRRHVVRLGTQVAAHMHHVAAIAGWDNVGIGSDVDAGCGPQETPVELDSVLDWQLIGDHAPTVARRGVLSGNWIRFLRETLPAA